MSQHSKFNFKGREDHWRIVGYDTILEGERTWTPMAANFLTIRLDEKQRWVCTHYFVF